VIWTEDWRGGEPNPLVPGGYRLKEEWDVDRELYPDFERVAEELHREGFAWHVYFAPFVATTSRVWNEAVARGALIKDKAGQPYLFASPTLGDTSMVDVTGEAGSAWAAEKMQAAFKLGADGFMGDYGEWLPTDAVLAAGNAREEHNRYPVGWQQAQRRAIDSMPDAIAKNRVSFVRSGWFGSPQLVDVFWGGDQSTDYGASDGIGTVIPIGLGLGLSGISTYGHDVGGYQTNATKPTTKELFFRWTELAAWSPVMRTHHTTEPKASWSFDRDEETLAHWGRYARLHMQLFPYLYGLARDASATGVPIWRQLAFHHPKETQLWGINDEFFVGPGVLVAPVVEENKSARRVLLPPGTYYRWEGGAPVNAADFVVPAPLGEVPVFVKPGTIVPMLTDEPQNADQAVAAQDRVVQVYCGQDGYFNEVAGATYTLQSTNTRLASPAPRANGVRLPTCANASASNCAVLTTDTLTVRVRGPQRVEMDNATVLEAAGVGVNASITFVVHFAP
jgi:sulfoquinovosidase